MVSSLSALSFSGRLSVTIRILSVTSVNRCLASAISSLSPAKARCIRKRIDAAKTIPIRGTSGARSGAFERAYLVDRRRGIAHPRKQQEQQAAGEGGSGHHVEEG